MYAIRSYYAYTVPLNFVLLGDSLYFHCATEGRKLDVLAANPAVSACIVGRADLLVPENSYNFV